MDILNKCLGLIDLTSLNSSDSDESIEELTYKVNKFKDMFPESPNPASICVYPNLVKTVRKHLRAEGVHITAVAGAFPTSQSFIEVKIMECLMAIKEGADEIDVVLPLGSFLSGDYDTCTHELREIRGATIGHTLKVILETGVLGTEENITKASQMAIACGADFIKTSTGKCEPAATTSAALIMCKCIRAHYSSTGKKIGFKPAGGISTPKDALEYLDIVKHTLGEEWITPELFRFGASRLANKILSEKEDRTILYY